MASTITKWQIRGTGGTCKPACQYAKKGNRPRLARRRPEVHYDLIKHFFLFYGVILSQNFKLPPSGPSHAGTNAQRGKAPMRGKSQKMPSPSLAKLVSIYTAHCCEEVAGAWCILESYVQRLRCSLVEQNFSETPSNLFLIPIIHKDPFL